VGRRILVLSLLLCLIGTACAEASPLGSRPLGRGDRGWDVLTLQRVLGTNGFSTGGVDGIFGRMTQRAVKRFQRSRGLAVDGRVGPITTHALAGRWALRRATYYGPGLWGNRTACGQVLRRRTVGVAHRTFACGTRLAVYANGRLVILTVIDRGPYHSGVWIDLTAAAAQKLHLSGNSSVRDRLIGG
jgi:rare lipoprotein A (peptidoglycan hydrolase)